MCVCVCVRDKNNSKKSISKSLRESISYGISRSHKSDWKWVKEQLKLLYTIKSTDV